MQAMRILQMVGILVLFGCSMGKHDKKIEMQNFEVKELIIYAKSGSDMFLKNGVFFAADVKTVSRINKELGNYDVTISQLGSKINSDDSDRNGASLIFILKVKGDAEALKDFLLKQTALIDGAYIKAPSEDPNK